jgi:dihydroorotate dehydrogenase
LFWPGPTLIPRINDGLVQLLRRDGFTHVSQAVGRDAKAIAAGAPAL